MSLLYHRQGVIGALATGHCNKITSDYLVRYYTMKPSNVSLLKLSRVSSRFLMRKSVKTERRCFVTILNPSAPKIKRLQRNSGQEAQAPALESEKISLLKKALEDLNLETEPPLASTEDSSVTEELQDLTKNVSPASEQEIDLTNDLPTCHKESHDNIIQVETEEAPTHTTQDSRADLTSEETNIAEGENKSAAKTTKASTADREDDDSSSSDSDSTSSSSSEDECEEKKPIEITRLDQVDFDSNPTLIQC